MKLSPEDYRNAASERIDAARQLFELKKFSDCIYLAGVATECILRAYRARVDPEFDSRHDLALLMRASGLEDLVPKKRRAEVGAALGEVWSRWKNDYRYTSGGRLGAALKARDLFHGIRGDALKANARIALENSLELVTIGVARWHNKNSSEE